MRQSTREILASILIPAMIGLLTVAMSGIQLYTASEQRAQDLEIAEENRLQELAVAAEKRQQELLIANQIRADTILADFIDDISEFVRMKSLAMIRNDSSTALVIRGKALTACRQLDRINRGHLILFLYDLGLITVGMNPIDLHGLELNNIDLSVQISINYLENNLESISLAGVSLVNASFFGRNLFAADLTGANLQRANFRFSDLRQACFRRTNLKETNFDLATTDQTDFSGSDLRRSNISDYQLSVAYSIIDAVLPNKTTGRNPNLIVDGNAEAERNCSSHSATGFRSDRWSMSPSNTVDVMKLNASLVDHVIYKWVNSMKTVLPPDDWELIASNFLWNTENCSFIINLVGNRTTFLQYFYVPKQYRNMGDQYLSWYLSLFCGMMENEVIITVTLTEFDSTNRTLQSTTKTFDADQGFMLDMLAFHSQTVFGLLEIKFALNNLLGKSFTQRKAVAFCDNVYLSLEITSVLAALVASRQ